MTIELNDLLLIILYEALIVFVIVLIVLGIKLIKTLKKVDIMVDDVNKKLEKLDSTFDIIDGTSDFAVSIGNKLAAIISSILNVFKKDKKGNDIDE